jgi:hypothetical protein
VPGAGAAAADQARAAARRANGVTSRAAFVVVPLAGGGVPAAWPAGLDLARLFALNQAAVGALLLAYGQPVAGSLAAKRVQLARFVGAIV